MEQFIPFGTEACDYLGARPTGYTPCEQQEHKLLGALRLCKSKDLRSRSNLRLLAHKHACRLVSLDYVASGSTDRAVKDRILVSPPTKTKKPRKIGATN